MRKSRMDRHKRSKKPWVISGIVGVIIVASAVVIYLYKDSLFPGETSAIEQPLEETKPSTPDVSEVLVTDSEKPAPPTIELDEGGYAINTSAITEPTYVEGILIANKKYPLPKDYNPGEVPEAKAAIDQMTATAKEAGYALTAFSGFRSYDYQTTLYTNYVNRDGKEAADRYSARPGHSEHQTGLAFDIGEVGKEDLWLTAEFGETPAGQWLVANADQYGFILRYPSGKEAITGFMYESWHFRYVGKETAMKVKEANVTLEEYLGIQ